MFTVVVLLASYGVLALTVLHSIAGNWSGVASLGNFAALGLSVPFLSVRAWQLRPARMGLAYSPWIWWPSLMFPILFLGFWAVVAATVTPLGAA
jgi:hypothetical protein